jgi:hypothetical protein
MDELPDHDSGNQIVITTSDMIVMLQRRAMRRKTIKKDRLLLLNAAYTIRQLVDRLAQYELSIDKVN